MAPAGGSALAFVAPTVAVVLATLASVAAMSRMMHPTVLSAPLSNQIAVICFWKRVLNGSFGAIFDGSG